MNKQDSIWIEISKSKLKQNMATIRKVVGKNVLVSPCVKANAYGHGLVDISKLLVRYGADWLSVNSISELERLKKTGIKKPILLMAHAQKNDLKKVIELKARAFVCNKDYANSLSKIAQKLDKKISVHIKIDTGMGRQGVVLSEALDFIKYVSGLKNIKVEGLATHFATIPNTPHFKKQLKSFKRLLNKLEKEKIKIPIIHSANSGAVLLNKDSHFNLVRPGISIYGYYPSEKVKKTCLRKKLKLSPVLNLKTKIVSIKTLTPSSCVSYGCTFTTKRKTKIAVLPIGYSDGLDRKLSSKGYVLVKGKKAKILGTICMNLTIVDVTNIKNTKTGDEVVVLGDKLTANTIAKQTDTINYEVLTNLKQSIPRYFVA